MTDTRTQMEIETDNMAVQLKRRLPALQPGIAMIEIHDGYLVFERRFTGSVDFVERFYWATTQSVALQLCFRGPQHREGPPR